MNLVLVGLNHKTAPVEVRECLAPAPEARMDFLREIQDLPGVRETFLLSTCNRVEVLAAVDDTGAEKALRDLLTQGRALEPGRIAQSLYVHQDAEAIRHLFRVASSLDSLVVGEPQILGQMKEAYREASEAGTTRTILNRLMHKTFQVAKKVRSETNIGGAAVSVSYAAVELARKIFEDLKGLKGLLVGAGEMAELAAEHLMNQGVTHITVANRTLERAVELAGRWRGAAVTLDELAEVLAEVDIVITSTGATQPVVTADMARRAVKRRRGKPLFFIDIAVPRDVDQRVGELTGCYVYDIDDLTQVVEANRESRREEARDAEGIVAREVVKFAEWLKGLEVMPTIAQLTQKVEDLRRAELDYSLRHLGDLSPEQVEAVDRLTRALTKKILHNPVMFLKKEHPRNPETKSAHLAMVTRLFGLDENGGSGGEE